MPKIKPRSAEECGVETRSEKGFQIQKMYLRKIAKDDRCTPSKRILVTMLLGYLDGVYPWSIIEDVFGNPARIKWSGNRDLQDDQEAIQADKVNNEAAEDIRLLYRELGKDATAGNATGIKAGNS